MTGFIQSMADSRIGSLQIHADKAGNSTSFSEVVAKEASAKIDKEKARAGNKVNNNFLTVGNANNEVPIAALTDFTSKIIVVRTTPSGHCVGTCSDPVAVAGEEEKKKQHTS
ncbi:hypothetical protein Tco_1113589 [Tanacetum coccineum]|uniref:Uncharacterized protein n=1 Tax=Tanacetum coccineum TaxID=301880 RepID=A0ABQ5ISL6_9ASTR